jgi:RNA polymerase sigma factor (sigma-70 family)
MEKELNKDYYLWKSFIEGNDDSFYKLYDQYADVLYHYGLHLSRDKELIKDSIHDLFLDLYKYRNKLSNTDNIRFYLVRSLRRKIHQAQIKTIPLIYDSNIQSSNDNQELAYEDIVIARETEEETTRLLTNAMKTLTAHQLEGLTLKFEHNLTYSEIAELLGMSIESARTSIYRALKILRSSITDDKTFIQ